MKTQNHTHHNMKTVTLNNGIVMPQIEAQRYMREVGIHLMAWAPLAEGRNGFFTNPVLEAIGARYHKSVAQVALRWLLQRDVIIIPKSTHRERMEQNIDILDFELSADDMAAIAALDIGRSLFFSSSETTDVLPPDGYSRDTCSRDAFQSVRVNQR